MSVKQRPAVEGEFCTCGRPAVRVYDTEKWGQVGDCDVHPSTQVLPCRFCGATERHLEGSRCPQYRLRPGT